MPSRLCTWSEVDKCSTHYCLMIRKRMSSEIFILLVTNKANRAVRKTEMKVNMRSYTM